MKLQNVAILVLITAIVSAVVTRYYFPQVQIKQVQTDDQTTQNNIRTIVKIVKHPDGSEETTSDTVDTSKKNESITNQTTIMAKKDWMISASTDYSFKDKTQSYEVQVQRRILGPFYLGAKASTNQSAGVMLGFEF